MREANRVLRRIYEDRLDLRFEKPSGKNCRATRCIEINFYSTSEYSVLPIEQVFSILSSPLLY